MAETSIRLCIAVWDVLAQIHALVGLPAKIGTPESLRHSTIEELFHAAQTTLGDESIWTALKKHQREGGTPYEHEIYEKLTRLTAEGGYT